MPDVSFWKVVGIVVATILITLPISLKKRTERMIVIGWCLFLVITLLIGVWFFSTHDVSMTKKNEQSQNSQSVLLEKNEQDKIEKTQPREETTSVLPFPKTGSNGFFEYDENGRPLK